MLEVKKIVFDLISLYLSSFAFTLKFYKTFRIAEVLLVTLKLQRCAVENEKPIYILKNPTSQCYFTI